MLLILTAEKSQVTDFITISNLNNTVLQLNWRTVLWPFMEAYAEAYYVNLLK
jgi:hypothetical protein